MKLLIEILTLLLYFFCQDIGSNMFQIVVQECSNQFVKPLVYCLLPFAEFPTVVRSGLKRSALAGILVGTIVAAIALSVVSTVFIMKRRRKRRTVSRRSRKSIFLFFSSHKNGDKITWGASKGFRVASQRLKTSCIFKMKRKYVKQYL